MRSPTLPKSPEKLGANSDATAPMALPHIGAPGTSLGALPNRLLS